MFGGPVLYIGLCLVGWVMVWNRPQHAFAATYALCLFILIVVLGGLYGGLYRGLSLMLDSLASLTLAQQIEAWVIFLAVIAALPVAFLVVSSAIVTLRKWMLSRRRA